MSWREVPLKETLDLLTDGTHYTPPSIGKGFPFLTVKDVTEDGLDLVGCAQISKMDYLDAIKQNSAPQSGDVLFSKDGTVGKVHLVDGEGKFAVLSSLAILRPSKKIDPGYLAAFLRTPQTLKAAARKKTGSAIRRIILRDLGSLTIPLPPLDEQRRIAAILDKADALRRKRKRALELLDGLTQSIFLEMFGLPGDLTSSTTQRPLSDLAELINGDRSSNYPSGDDIVSSGILFLNTTNITPAGLDVSNANFISEEKFASLTRGKLKNGDIIITLRGTLGQAAIFEDVGGTGFINAQMMIIRPNDRVNRHYLLQALKLDSTRSQLAQMGSGSAVPQLTAAQMKEFLVPSPNVEDQILFSQRSKKLLPIRRILQKSIVSAQEVFSSLQSRAFSGQL